MPNYITLGKSLAFCICISSSGKRNTGRKLLQTVKCFIRLVLSQTEYPLADVSGSRISSAFRTMPVYNEILEGQDTILNMELIYISYRAYAYNLKMLLYDTLNTFMYEAILLYRIFCLQHFVDTKILAFEAF